MNVRLSDYYNGHVVILFLFNSFWTSITCTLALVSVAFANTHRDHCFPVAVALIRRDSSCSFSTNNYLTSCHNQIPLIMGTIQRLPGVIKLARVFLDFQLSPVGGALYPGRWLGLWLGAQCCTEADSSSLAITMRIGLMRWQDGPPALLSLSFGSLLRPLVLSSSPCTCSAPETQRSFCLPPLYTEGDLH